MSAAASVAAAAPILYEINPRAFSPAGNFAGIHDRLDHLVQLGVTVLWLMPIHPAGVVGRKGPLGSPYSATDYFAIDPAYGSAEELKALVREVHTRGLRIILDIAANHTACDAVLWQQHPEFYRRDPSTGRPLSSEEAWSDVYALDYSNPEVRETMRSVFRYWVQEFDFDGFRCDIAHYVPRDFWESVRADLGPEVLLIAEADDPALTEHGCFDAGYAWKFFHTLNSVFTEGLSAVRLREVWERSQLTVGGRQMRFTDNHDETRAIVRLGESASLAAAAIIFLLDGIPLLYNGQEIGDTAESGPPALFDRVPIYWGNAERRPDFLRFYRQLIHLRRAHSALHSGEVLWTHNTGADRVVSFLREGDNQEFLVAVNCSNRTFDGHVDGGTQPVSLAPFGILVRERKWGVLLSR
jgi:cyclomaltodextrinase / maltogenic alpha-amylase / neopullulanase